MKSSILKLQEGQLVKIIANKPAEGQDSINSLIGKTVKIQSVGFKYIPGLGKTVPDGTVSVKVDEPYDGLIIILQPEEFELVPEE